MAFTAPRTNQRHLERQLRISQRVELAIDALRREVENHDQDNENRRDSLLYFLQRASEKAFLLKDADDEAVTGDPLEARLNRYNEESTPRND